MAPSSGFPLPEAYNMTCHFYVSCEISERRSKCLVDDRGKQDDNMLLCIIRVYVRVRVRACVSVCLFLDGRVIGQ